MQDGFPHIGPGTECGDSLVAPRKYSRSCKTKYFSLGDVCRLARMYTKITKNFIVIWRVFPKRTR